MYCLGKTPARPDAVKLKFGTYFDKSALPTPPMRFGSFRINDWDSLGNNKYSDCVWAGAAHETQLWGKVAGKPVEFTTESVLSDYSATTGFNPADPNTDQGTDMPSAASYRRKTGILDAAGNRHKVDSYVALAPGNVDDAVLAAYIFGAIGVGIRFPRTATAQFSAAEPWDVVPNARIEGGHYIPCIGRNSAGNLLVVTWGRLHAMTPAFYQEYSDEALAYVAFDWLDNRLLSPEGYDIDTLRRDLALLKY